MNTVTYLTPAQTACIKGGFCQLPDKIADKKMLDQINNLVKQSLSWLDRDKLTKCFCSFQD